MIINISLFEGGDVMVSIHEKLFGQSIFKVKN